MQLQSRHLDMDPAARARDCAELVDRYYTATTALYRSGWDDSFHIPPFQGDESIGEAVREQERRLAEAAGFGPGASVLDAGSGVGGPAVTIAGHTGARVTGVNVCGSQVTLARALAAERGLAGALRFVEGDVARLPFNDASFDGAYSFDALCHLPDKEQGYREIARVLKPGGVFCGYDWFCRDGITDEEYEDYIEPVCRTFAVNDLITLAVLDDLLSRAGFVVDHVTDAARHGNIARNWDIFARKHESLGRYSGAEAALLRSSAAAIARAGRAGMFLVGYWMCRKAG